MGRSTGIEPVWPGPQPGALPLSYDRRFKLSELGFLRFWGFVGLLVISKPIQNPKNPFNPINPSSDKQPTRLRLPKKTTPVKPPTVYPFTKWGFLSNVWGMKGMKYLILATILLLSLTGGGCLEEALEYPKEFTSDNQTSVESTVSLIGVIRSLNTATGQMELETDNGFVEEVIITTEAAISLNSEERKTLTDLTVNSLAEIFGTRNPTTLIITARTVRAEDLTKIKIVTPTTGVTVTSPLIVNGFAKTIDQKIYWRVKDQNNATQLSGSDVVGGEAQNYTSFRLEIYLPAFEANNFTLEIFSQQKTAEVGLVSLPLNLLSTNKSEFQVFLSNDRLNTTRACDIVFPVKRVVAETSAVGRASLLQLLNGPTETERYESYRSSLPYNTTITSFVINGGTATVTVSKELEKASKCEKQRAEEQIRQTLMQIKSIRDVVIQIEK